MSFESYAGFIRFDFGQYMDVYPTLYSKQIFARGT